ncbi:ester cyclase [Xanthobacter sp. 126]|uniref:ester cyclase n=1 Tax=Xanthobacter sp. 126 TaxID=1131814 RepID=UPI00045EB696|nr:ester cyclase [Xanthobacter sp. 126]
MNPTMDDEVPMTFEGYALSPQKEIVRKFYKDMWDHADVSLIPEIFHPDFTFRGSLGPTVVGHAQFADYVRWVTACLDNYTSDIFVMIEEGAKVSAKLRFHGIHRQSMFGHAASGRHVWWNGAPIFTFEGPLVRDLWVLGDVYGLINRIEDNALAEPEFRTVA